LLLAVLATGFLKCRLERIEGTAGLPMLDPELVELAFRISWDVVYHRGERKALLKAALRDRLPPEVLTTRKQGFSVPMNDWMRRGILQWGAPLVRNGTLVGSGILDRNAVAHQSRIGMPAPSLVLQR